MLQIRRLKLGPLLYRRFSTAIIYKNEEKPKVDPFVAWATDPSVRQKQNEIRNAEIEEILAKKEAEKSKKWIKIIIYSFFGTLAFGYFSKIYLTYSKRKFDKITYPNPRSFVGWYYDKEASETRTHIDVEELEVLLKEGHRFLSIKMFGHPLRTDVLIQVALPKLEQEKDLDWHQYQQAAYWIDNVNRTDFLVALIKEYEKFPKVENAIPEDVLGNLKKEYAEKFNLIANEDSTIVEKLASIHSKFTYAKSYLYADFDDYLTSYLIPQMGFFAFFYYAVMGV